MEPKFQTSFIPKTPITSNNASSYKPENSFSVIGIISTVLFVVALLASGGLFGYEMYINSQIQKTQAALAEARLAFQSEDNQKIILVSDQLKAIKTLLDNHMTVSPIFELLEQQTLPTVRLTSFSFAQDSASEVTVMIKGEAQNYASLAQQTKIFSELGYLKNIEVTDITLSETGTVGMALKAHIDPNILLYTKVIQSVSVIDNSSSQL
jgi:hypothetical protein